MHTEHVNHDPASKFLHTGFQIAGRPSAGAWVNYALGSNNKDLPDVRRDELGHPGGVPIDAAHGPRLHAVALPGRAVPLRAGAGAPTSRTRKGRRRRIGARCSMRSGSWRKAAQHHRTIPEILSKISQYEMAYRMQTSVPEVADISSEPDHVLDLYGPDVRKPGTFARNCLLARRLAERDVRYTMVVHMGWDHHVGIARLPGAVPEVDQPSAGLVSDLKQRGCSTTRSSSSATEFGRTSFAQGALKTNFGRDHHGGNFSVWLAGGGVKRARLRRDRRVQLQHRQETRCTSTISTPPQQSLPPRGSPRGLPGEGVEGNLA